MIGAPRIEEATPADLAALGAIRRQMGWSRSEDLLDAIVRWSGGRIFVIREGELAAISGEVAHRPAVATVATASPPVGVIGSVMVRPEFQRGGLGRAIMEHAISWLERQGARHIFLDATPAGRPLYRRLGFVDVTSSWYTRAPLASLDSDALGRVAACGNVARVVGASADALPRLAALDRIAYGGDRLGLIDALARQDGHELLIAETATGEPLGFLMLRPSEPPLGGVRLGPLVAHNDATAAALMVHALAKESDARAGALIASINGDNPRALALFNKVGATPIEDDLIMRLEAPKLSATTDGPGEDSGKRASVYCWLAPMVF
ncbi:MAG TPA: GNAT family N-acetyltransferase [Ktedonobacterales bacterium]